MGGAESEVSDSTTRVLLEVATWDGVNILRTSRRLGLRSDASNRFEKQLHPELAIRAQRVASRLMVGLCGARLVPGTIDVAADPPAPRRVHLRPARAEELLGMRIEPARCAEYLERLGFEVSGAGEEIVAEVPAHRYYDVTREADLIEEVGRIHGYAEHLPSTLPGGAGRAGGLSRAQALRRRAEDVMRDLGYDAVVTLSLTDPGLPGRLRIPSDDARARPIVVSNPLSAEHSALRTTLLGPLLDAGRHNLAHGAERIALFESGHAHLAQPPDPVAPGREAEQPARNPAAPGREAEEAAGGSFLGELPPPAYEPRRIAALAVGPLVPPAWRGDAVEADFYSVKGTLEALARQLGCEVAVEAAEEPFLHPGHSGQILVAGRPIGWIGELHPLIGRAWDLEGGAAFELDLAPLLDASPYGAERYEDVISYPAVHEDIAVVVGAAVEAERVRAAVLAAGGELLRSARIFDVYSGEQVGEGRTSLALRLEFRAPDRTLTDEEVAERRTAITEALTRIGGTLRE
jgi:phenylalanyl-tRNA synthetase beta chain